MESVEQAEVRLEYQSPELTEYGSLVELTGNEVGTVTDGLDGSLVI